MTELFEIMKALGDKTRYHLLKLLLQHDLCVRTLAERLNISESAVSQHLKVLRQAEIVKGDKRGYYTHYYVNRSLLKDAAQTILSLSQLEKTPSICPSAKNNNKCHEGRCENE